MTNLNTDIDQITEVVKKIMKQDEEIFIQIEIAKRAAKLLDLDDEAFEMTLESETDTFDHCEMLASAAILVAADARKNKQLADYYKCGKDHCEIREEKIRSRITRLIRATNRTSLQTPTANLSIRQTESVEIIELDLVPEKYIQFDPKPVKTLIYLDLKDGIPVPGCRLNEKTSLTIKAK